MSDKPQAHPISPSHAFFLAGAISTSYVLSVYVSTLIAKPRPPLWRNDPVVIRVRSIFACLSTLLCCGVVYLTIRSSLDDSSDAIEETFKYLGAPYGRTIPSLESLRAHLIVPALFAGPLYATFLGEALPFQQNWNLQRDVISRLTTSEGFRNYIMAPATEEITYRACVLSVYQLAGYSKSIMIWVAPCWFGLAHIHHSLETYKRLGKTSAALRTALIGTAFQFAYTTLFGWLCSFLFLRTGSIIVPIVAHMFCNIMGFPAITWELSQFPSRKNIIILTYVFGVILFFYSLYPWSSNPSSLYWGK